MNTLTARLRSALWWLMPAVVLACAIGWETDWGRALRKPLPAEEAITPKPVETALLPEYEIAGGVAARQETTGRTLFNPTRRPAPLAQQDANARLQRGQFVLTGTLVADGKSTAFLRETAGSKAARRVQQGQSINGMLVAEVRPDRVRLTLGDEAEELVLKVATNPRPTPQPAPATASAAGGATPVAMPTTSPPVATTAATPAGQVAPAAATAPQGIPQSLAERRRAARAAEAAAGAAAGSTPTTAGAAAAPAAPVDPRFQQLDQRFREPVTQGR